MNITYTAAEARIVKHNNVSNPCHLFNFPVAWAWHPGDATLMFVFHKKTGLWYRRRIRSGRGYGPAFVRLTKEKHLPAFVRRAIPLLALTDGELTPLGKIAVSTEYVGYWVIDPVNAWDQWCWEKSFL